MPALGVLPAFGFAAAQAPAGWTFCTGGLLSCLDKVWITTLLLAGVLHGMQPELTTLPQAVLWRLPTTVFFAEVTEATS